MLNLIYSKPSLQSQVEQGHIFLLAEEGDKPIAYAIIVSLKTPYINLIKFTFFPRTREKALAGCWLNTLFRQ